MKIGFDAKRLYQNSSGLGQYSRYVVEHLSELYPQEEYLLYAASESSRWREAIGTFRPIGSGASVRRFASLNSHWESDQIDVYHGLSNELPWYANGADAGLVVTIHDLLFMDFPEDYPWLDRQIYLAKTKRAVKIADKIVAISQATKLDLINRLNVPEEKIEVIYQSCDQRFFEKETDTVIQDVLDKYHLRKPYVICIGSFSHRKNQEALLRSWSTMDLSHDVELVLVGAENKYVKQLKRQIPASDSVHFLHHVNFPEIRALLQGSLTSVYPSKKEGFGIPVLEALASGRTCLVAEGTSCAEAGQSAVLTFDAKSRASLAESLSNLILQDDLRHTLESGADSVLNTFDPKRQIPRLHQLYMDL